MIEILEIGVKERKNEKREIKTWREKGIIKKRILSSNKESPRVSQSCVFRVCWYKEIQKRSKFEGTRLIISSKSLRNSAKGKEYVYTNEKCPKFQGSLLTTRRPPLASHYLYYSVSTRWVRLEDGNSLYRDLFTLPFATHSVG